MFLNIPSHSFICFLFSILQAIKHQLDCSNVVLSKYHDESLQLVVGSSDSQPHHGVLLYTECQLFKLSALYYKCHSLLREKAQVLHRARDDYGSLYNDLKELAECLEESNKLLIHRDELLDVGQFLHQCKVCVLYLYVQQCGGVKR